MTPSFFKPIALEAKRELASENLLVGSSHLHELLAALHGFNTAIAFKNCLSDYLVGDTAPPLLVLLDAEQALARCQSLMPGIEAWRVVTALTDLLRRSPYLGAVYHLRDRWANSLIGYIRSSVLQEPRMRGVADDANARLGEILNAGWGDNHIQRSNALNSGPVRVGEHQVRTDVGRGRIEATGTYTNTDGEQGSFDLQAHFEELRPRLYALTRCTVDSRPGVLEDDEDPITDFPYPSED